MTVADFRSCIWWNQVRGHSCIALRYTYKMLCEENVERGEKMLIVSFLPNFFFEILIMRCFSTMQPFGELNILVSNLNYDQGRLSYINVIIFPF